MLIEHLKSSRNGLLIAALLMSLGGVGAVQAAETGVSPPPLKAPPVLPGTKPAVPMTSPAVPMTSPALPGAKPAMPMTAPAALGAKPAPATAATAATAGVSGNPDGSCPESAPIKGSRSKIYHAPEGRSYAKTKAKACFASAEAAEQAGYRAPKK